MWKESTSPTPSFTLPTPSEISSRRTPLYLTVSFLSFRHSNKDSTGQHQGIAFIVWGFHPFVHCLESQTTYLLWISIHTLSQSTNPTQPNTAAVEIRGKIFTANTFAVTILTVDRPGLTDLSPWKKSVWRYVMRSLDRIAKLHTRLDRQYAIGHAYNNPPNPTSLKHIYFGLAQQ